MSAHTDKHKQNLALLFDSHISNTKLRLPKFADAFEKTLLDKLQRPFVAFLDKVEAIRTSGRYSPAGERKELHLVARAFNDDIAQVRTNTVTKLNTQLADQRAAALKPKVTTDPAAALVRELRLRELRDHLRTVPPVMLAARIKQAVEQGANLDLLDALEGAPAGFPIAPAALMQEARVQIAERDHPELGELAQLRDAYTYATQVTYETLLAATGLHPVELDTPPTPARKDPEPFLVSSGKPVGAAQ